MKILSKKKHTLIPSFFIFLSFYFSNAGFSAPLNPKNDDNNILIMREFKVEGELDNPAIIIVPKAKLSKKEMFKKSYYNDIVREIYMRKSFNPIVEEKKVESVQQKHK